MASEPEPDASAGRVDPRRSADAGPPSETPGRGSVGPGSALLPAPPRSIRIASVLWICLGVVALLIPLSVQQTDPAYEGGSASDQLYDRPFTFLVELLTPLIWAGAVAIIVLGQRVRRGSERARRWLPVLGAVSLVLCWPALFYVPALMLQSRPESKAWFDAVDGHRAT
jgi:hypothetical protein